MRSAPRASGAMAPERAGTERPDRRVETLDPTERLLRGRETARVRTPGCACSVARAGGSEGWARRPARATAPGPRGKKEASRSERQETGVRGKAPRKRQSLGKCSTLTLIAGAPSRLRQDSRPPSPPRSAGAKLAPLSLAGAHNIPRPAVATGSQSRPHAASQSRLALLPNSPPTARPGDPATGFRREELPYEPQTLTPIEIPIVLGRIRANPTAPLGRIPTAGATALTPVSFVRFFPYSSTDQGPK